MINHQEYIINLKKTREEINERLIDLALDIAAQGKKLYDLKEELRLVKIKIKNGKE